MDDSLIFYLHLFFLLFAPTVHGDVFLLPGREQDGVESQPSRCSWSLRRQMRTTVFRFKQHDCLYPVSIFVVPFVRCFWAGKSSRLHILVLERIRKPEL